MKKIILATAMAVTFGSSNIFAHHPAADIVDPEIYDMISSNISDSHLDMDMDSVGNDATGGAGNDSDEGPGNSGDVGERAAAAAVEDVEEIQGQRGPRS